MTAKFDSQGLATQARTATSVAWCFQPKAFDQSLDFVVVVVARPGPHACPAFQKQKRSRKTVAITVQDRIPCSLRKLGPGSGQIYPHGPRIPFDLSRQGLFEGNQGTLLDRQPRVG